MASNISVVFLRSDLNILGNLKNIERPIAQLLLLGNNVLTGIIGLIGNIEVRVV